MRCLLFLTTLQGYSPKSERGGSGTCCCPYLFLGQRSFHENLRSWPCCSQAQHRIAAAHSSVRRTPLVGCRTCMHTYAIFMIVYPPPSRRHLTKGRGFTILLFVSAPSFLLLRRLSVRHHDRRAVHGGWTYDTSRSSHTVCRYTSYPACVHQNKWTGTRRLLWRNNAESNHRQEEEQTTIVLVFHFCRRRYCRCCCRRRGEAGNGCGYDQEEETTMMEFLATET